MIVLASKSASRRSMLEAAGVAFTCDPARIDERAVEAALGMEDPATVVVALAQAKAQDVARRNPGALVLGSDSLVSVEGRRFDKPRDCKEAAAHLRSFSGLTMELHSAAALARDDATIWRHGAIARLKVRALSNDFIEDYLAAEWPAVATCVGVFRIEARGVHLFESIEGDHFTVLGMPLLAVLGALREHGELA